MERQVLDLVVTKATELRPGYAELRLAPLARHHAFLPSGEGRNKQVGDDEPESRNGTLPAMLPGQFVEVRVDATPSVFLRRPISVNNVFDGELWLLVHAVGEGTRWLTSRREGDVVNVLGPLGNGFDLNAAGARPLLVGGGVGTAPLLYLGRELLARGAQPTFILGGRTADDLMQLEEFERVGQVLLTTEDGSAGERGFVTQHSGWDSGPYTGICTCGPKPMMRAVAMRAKELGITSCQLSLENMMACGLGACLCCVEDTIDGNVCVCKEGPVFEAKRLKW